MSTEALQILKCHRRWLKFDREHWLAACAKPQHGLVSWELGLLLEELASHFPQPGHQTHAEIPVVLRKGRHIAMHAHAEWLIIYWPFGNPAALILGEQRHVPVGNTAVLLPPGTAHGVERVTTKHSRISLALRWRCDTNDSN